MRLRRGALLITLFAAAVAFAVPSAAQAQARCPATFTVLHNDRVGTLAIPAGPYTLNPTGLSCANASRLLSRFLSDFDGVLPGGWSTAATGLGFANAATGASFTLAAATTPSGGGSTSGRCAGTFTVEHNDRIGALRLRAGRYAINARRISCAAASRRFAFFLFHDSAGTLPPGWRLNLAAQRFSRGRTSFTVRRVSRSGRSGGGGVHPNVAITCPGTVTLAAGTSIGAFVLPAGAYYVNVFSNLGCTTATALFQQFAASGSLPPTWVLEPDTGTFLRGHEGFQVEAAT